MINEINEEAYSVVILSVNDIIMTLLMKIM
jgi:hypothetical protein